MKLFPLVALALLLPQADEAASLFKKFEKALKESKGLELSFSSTFNEQGKEVGELSGTFRLARENKAWIEADGTINGKKVSIRVVSDGQLVKLSTTERENVNTMPTPLGMNEDLITRFARSSAKQAIQALHKKLLRMDDERGGVRSPEPDLANLPPGVGHFKMGPPEVVGSSKRHQLQFEVTDSGSADRWDAVLWLDQETLEPVRRSLDPLRKGGSKIGESYTQVSFESKFDRDTFKVNRR